MPKNIGELLVVFAFLSILVGVGVFYVRRAVVEKTSETWKASSEALQTRVGILDAENQKSLVRINGLEEANRYLAGQIGLEGLTELTKAIKTLSEHEAENHRETIRTLKQIQESFSFQTETDRKQVHELMGNQGKLIDKVDDITREQRDVASNLTRATTRIEGVASDLAESRKVADAVPEDEPSGAAADAASKTPPEEKEN